MAFTLWTIFGAWIALTALGVVAAVRSRIAFTAYLDGTGSYSDVSATDAMLAAYSILNILFLVVTIGVFLAWFYRCYSNITALSSYHTECSKKSAI